MLACGSDDSASQPHSDSDCDLDGCSILEEGLFKTEDNFQVTVPDFSLVWVPACLMACAAQVKPSLEKPGPPPRSDHSLAGPSWQFAYRTALPVRAPALLA